MNASSDPESKLVIEKETNKKAQHVTVNANAVRKTDEEFGKIALEKKQSVTKEGVISEDRLKISDLLNFTSAIFVVIGTAVFYFSGWIYMSAWYGYYGIDLSQVQISTQVILMYGIPAIIFTALIISTSVLLASRVAEIRQDFREKNRNSLLIALFACLLSLLFTILISWVSKSFLSNEGAIQYVLIDKSTSAFRWMFSLLLILILFSLCLTVIIPKISRRNPSSVAINQDLSAHPIFSAGFLSQTWQIWVVITFIIFFLSITTTAWQLGAIDAFRGTHIMTGNLEPANVNLYSSIQVAALEEFKRGSSDSNEFIYGPLLLIHSDQNAYYLSNPKLADRFSSGPKVYVVPKTGNIMFFIETKEWFVATSEEFKPELKPITSPTMTITVQPTLSVTLTSSSQP